jgi:hypothetical protein
MVALETEKSEFTASFVFVPRINGILLLTAEIRAEVCLASGETTFFDASEFIKNYRTDIYVDTEIPDFSGRLPPNLTMEKADICYADIGGKKQICYIHKNTPSIKNRERQFPQNRHQTSIRLYKVKPFYVPRFQCLHCLREMQAKRHQNPRLYTVLKLVLPDNLLSN